MLKLFATAAVLVASAIEASAGVVTLIGSTVTVSNAVVASSSVAIQTVVVPPKTLYVQNGGVLTTNGLIVLGQLSLDGTNWTTVQQFYQPAITNAQVDTWNVTNTTYNVFARVVVVTTNQPSRGVDVGVQLQQ